MLLAQMTSVNAYINYQPAQMHELNTFRGLIKGYDTSNVIAEGWQDTATTTLNGSAVGNTGSNTWIKITNNSNGYNYLTVDSQKLFRQFDEVISRGVLHLGFDLMYASGGAIILDVFYSSGNPNQLCASDGSYTNVENILACDYTGNATVPFKVTGNSDETWHRYDIYFDYMTYKIYCYVDGTSVGDAKSFNYGLNGVRIRSVNDSQTYNIDNLYIRHYVAGDENTVTKTVNGESRLFDKVEMIVDFPVGTTSGTDGVMEANKTNTVLRLGFSESMVDKDNNSSLYDTGDNDEEGAKFQAVALDGANVGMVYPVDHSVSEAEQVVRIRWKEGLPAGNYRLEFIGTEKGRISGADVYCGNTIFTIGDGTYTPTATSNTELTVDDFRLYKTYAAGNNVGNGYSWPEAYAPVATNGSMTTADILNGGYKLHIAGNNGTGTAAAANIILASYDANGVLQDCAIEDVTITTDDYAVDLAFGTDEGSIDLTDTTGTVKCLLWQNLSGVKPLYKYTLELQTATAE